MSLQQPIAAPDPQAEATQFFSEILHDLILRGADFAKRLHEQAIALPPEGPNAAPMPITPQTIAAFDVIARAVRRSILLAQKIAEPPRPAPAHNHNRAVRKRIIREVEDTIQRECDGHVAKALDDELLERLDSPDLDDEITHRSTKEIIADICRDLGIAHIEGTHPWKRRTPVDIRVLNARATRPAPDPQSIRPGLTPKPVKLPSG